MLQSEPQLYADLVIASGGTESNWVRISPTLGQFAGIIWPSPLDGTIMAVQCSVDGGATPVKVEDITFAVSTYQELATSKYRGVKLIRLKAATAQSGGERTMKLIGNVIA